MELIVNVKHLGKRKNSVQEEKIQIEGQPQTVKELICAVVKSCVSDYNKRMEAKEILNSLTKEEIEKQAESGKVDFGVNYGEHMAEEEKAIANALCSFEDGIYRIYLGTEELVNLEDEITLTPESRLTFIRLVMLAGRLW